MRLCLGTPKRRRQGESEFVANAAAYDGLKPLHDARAPGTGWRPARPTGPSTVGSAWCVPRAPAGPCRLDPIRLAWPLVRLKTGILAAGLALSGLLASFATDHVQIPLNPRWADQLTLDLVLLHRPRPCSEAVLAFALAAAIGAYLRRTLAAPRHIV
jgi:hypothetical protein